MSLSKEQQAFTRDVVKLLNKAFEIGYEITLGEAERPQLMQDYYLQTGKTKAKVSLHTSRLAIDINVFKDGVLVEVPDTLGNFWESLNPLNSWGGRGITFIDKPHFSRGNGKPEFKRFTVKD